MRDLFWFFLAILMAGRLSAQSKLDAYIGEGIKNNEGIRQQQFLLEKSRYALAEAKALFLPYVALNTTYTLAGGGRTVDIPVGELMNPVYARLNQLTASNSFPKINNQRIPLNPNNFYNLHVRTSYPVFNPELKPNQTIKEVQQQLQAAELQMFKRELIKEIKVAYFQYLQSLQATDIYRAALKLAAENLRVNISLFNNQKVNRTAVVRAENEVTKIGAEIKAALQTEKNAQAYFNFLLNKPLASSIEIETVYTTLPILSAADASPTKREELQQVALSKTINEQLIILSKSYRHPKLGSFLDVGMQNFDFRVNPRSPYYLFGLSLEWTLFSGGKNKQRTLQAEADLHLVNSQEKNIAAQLQLQVSTATNSFLAASARYGAAITQVAASEKYYNDMLRLYKEGQVLFIELLDAQNQWIAAKLGANISLFDAWIKSAEVERATAGFLIK